ncbi:hypothetical protein [Bordetella sp. FB-8]|uniref:hypothetical protein n=1 Tax=Bordetella sp. FB-8 TaxID=1159870 RepID=UPI00035E11D6|nr:hypothetical protein [Bordetella sp. FB-8]
MHENQVKDHAVTQDGQAKNSFGKSAGRTTSRAQAGIAQRPGKLPFSQAEMPETGRDTSIAGKKP